MPLLSLSTQKGKSAKPKAPVADPAKGRNLFGANCAVCHGSTGQGDEGPRLRGIKLKEDRIVAIIGTGFEGQMPSFKRLKLDDRKAIAAYVKSLK